MTNITVTAPGRHSTGITVGGLQGAVIIAVMTGRTGIMDLIGRCVNSRVNRDIVHTTRCCGMTSVTVGGVSDKDGMNTGVAAIIGRGIMALGTVTSCRITGLTGVMDR